MEIDNALRRIDTSIKIALFSEDGKRKALKSLEGLRKSIMFSNDIQLNKNKVLFLEKNIFFAKEYVKKIPNKRWLE